MEKNLKLYAIYASLIFLIATVPVATAMDDQTSTSAMRKGGGVFQGLRDHHYYKQELKKLEESTARIHKEVDRILAEFKRNMEKYYRFTRGQGGGGIES